ncbi:hypothetical protein MACJ_002501 [Theileria orientalis]|uniref:Uncharacterized protein n=1 Tax=Theileria orientalis TaxID=68886 RepID=A0A976M6B7_THEOR|nr:hypothetical protein MACJ_002501 [Theileria orientalis]
MRLYRKFLLFVFVYLIQGNDIKIGGPLFVEGYGDVGGNRSTPADKTSTPCEKTAAVDIKKYVETTYTRKIEGSVITYEPQPGYCFNEVKDSGTTVWSTRDQNEYSKKVEADFGTRTVTIYIGSDGGLTKVFKKGDDDKWAEDAEASTYKGGTGTSDSSGLDCSCGPDCSCGTGCSWSRTWDIIIKYVFCGCCGCCGSGDECGFCGLCGLCQSRGFTGGKIGVDLDITKTKSGLFSREFDHALDGNYTTYTAKGSNAFRLVKEGSNEIWKASDESEYSTRVELDNLSFESRAITIYLAEKRTKVFIKLGRDEPFNEIDTAKVTTKPINIGYAYNSYFSALRTQGNVRIFTARRGFAFNGANVYLDDKKKVEIWKTDQESEYANKIVNVGGNKVEIHLVNGSGKVFTKASPVEWKQEAYAPEFISAEAEEESSGWLSSTWNKITGWFGSSGSSGGSSGPGGSSGGSSGPSGSPSGQSSGSSGPSGQSSVPSKSSAEKPAGSAARTAGGGGEAKGINSWSSSAAPPTTPKISGTQQASSATLPSTTPQTAGTPTVTTGQPVSTATAGQAASSTPAKTGQSGTKQSSAAPPSTIPQTGGTQPSSTPPARTGSQQHSSTQHGRTVTQQQSTTQPGRTGYQQQSTTPQTGGTQPSSTQRARTSQSGTQSASTYKAGHTAAMTRQAGGVHTRGGSGSGSGGGLSTPGSRPTAH